MADEWHKSTYSGGSNDCVEIREKPDGADVRDTRHRAAGHLSFSPAEWCGFLRGLRGNRSRLQ
ncbi:DUF397 domain-containing protein [Nocardiopsis aegyptia]|uniref:DUF397 domain-containing protein n=1 Tax=Nocardiopsis aegyptia TaxID=220378 RepID=A0A7Z0ENZ8_9ACTN|nr:DUF397 domain-containing protein [Nocardiopsis aegyptia]NYJ34783.1 hypothetical protein [Nocardiopsis aegyptia]